MATSVGKKNEDMKNRDMKSRRFGIDDELRTQNMVKNLTNH